MRKCVVVALLSLLPLVPAVSHADAYHAKPKLVVILVIDQFRGDYLDRYRSDFKTPSGFNLFLNRGAHFTDCYYDYANTMTAPGHSTIGTGAYTDGHGISLNEWWDLKRSTTHPVSSVEDERYAVVGDPDSKDVGASPRNQLASTVGDEVVLASGGKSKLFGISLKDRAAILTSGHASNGAFWLDHASGKFVTSTYWATELPPWAQAFNNSGRAAQALHEAGAQPGHFYEEVGATPASVTYLLDFAKSLVSGEQMGHHDTTDVLTISISSTDILGHKVGPDAPEQRAMIDAIDVDLNDFFTWLDKHVDGGMANVWVALSGDHGVAPVPAVAAKEGMPATPFSSPKLIAALEVSLNKRYSPGKSTKYILGGELPYIQIDPRAFTALKITEAEAEQTVADMLPDALESTLPPAPEGVSQTRLPPRPLIRRTYTRLQMAAGQIPATDEGRLVLHSYSPNGGWYVMLAPGMYEMASASGTNHFTPYSYDRHVPLDLFGSAFIPGTYHDRVAPIDIASTLASLLRVNQPSAAAGRVLTMAIRPEPAASSRTPIKVAPAK
ncbi:alkaline phosphatase family protein [Granulicella sp. dw_53]|uniref:alkaline phosphatase family protein n=1 Tax=Granulicella sp. dw_53 TaxID=2719792 RepID=UPI001BD1FB1D|nr:alkaline phosphatase family protein [Granulicella sp. dw_53]